MIDDRIRPQGIRNFDPAREDEECGIIFFAIA
jgi:hypothetical protein